MVARAMLDQDLTTNGSSHLKVSAFRICFTTMHSSEALLWKH